MKFTYDEREIKWLLCSLDLDVYVKGCFHDAGTNQWQPAAKKKRKENDTKSLCLFGTMSLGAYQLVKEKGIRLVFLF